MRHGGVTVVVLILSGAGVLAVDACVSDDTQNGPQPGTLGGPCLQNGTCDNGFTCVIAGSSTLCEVPDATTDSGGDVVTDHNVADVMDAGGGDTATDATDAAPPCDAAITSHFTCSGSTSEACYDFATTDHQCVTGTTSCQSLYTNIFLAQCYAGSTCQTSQPWCCLGGGLSDTLTGCPGTLTIGQNAGAFCYSTATAPCVDAGIALCDLTVPCPNGHACIPVDVTQPPGLAGQIFGVCEP